MMTIRAYCTTCRAVIATAGHWSRAVTCAAVHEHRDAVRVEAAMTPAEWRRVPRDSRVSRRGERRVLHLDSDGATILVPVRIDAKAASQ